MSPRRQSSFVEKIIKITQRLDEWQGAPGNPPKFGLPEIPLSCGGTGSNQGVFLACVMQFKLFYPNPLVKLRDMMYYMT